MLGRENKRLVANMRKQQQWLMGKHFEKLMAAMGFGWEWDENPDEEDRKEIKRDMEMGVDGWIRGFDDAGLRVLSYDKKFPKTTTVRVKLSSKDRGDEISKWRSYMTDWTVTVLKNKKADMIEDIMIIGTMHLLDYYDKYKDSLKVYKNSQVKGNTVSYVRLPWKDLERMYGSEEFEDGVYMMSSFIADKKRRG